ncbi:glycoside hydrolase family 32 protein [Bacillus sp. SB49]|uniref:glycoside hydrolase family 32 protein n=1 Tax=Bacillus sp. SB49 TaxID=1071080 RepID=UPI0004119F20|nr:glycoside hydrolase family 32 protein [Bacillus sp. SB49]QHT47973.1 glycoside hydrolase family 32 protein [Bacillus sp. SB49]
MTVLKETPKDFAREKYRPQYHFSPKENWMNDPNGMVYFHGEYHLFYQYHPFGTTWGPMHWGHAVSKDMVEWEHLPVALEPDEHGMIFSGSCVVDWEDTSGLFDGNAGLVAIFTHAKEVADGNHIQKQSLAYSKDDGRTWVKYAGNPVLEDASLKDFRDPKVFWHAPDRRWVMVLAAGDWVNIYTSPNLIEWSYASSFGKEEGAHLGVWECPDLFPLQVDTSNEKKWVMIVSIGDDPQYEEGSRTQYFIGEFDGEHFVADEPEAVRWLDYGRDNYAGVTWSDIPEEDGRRILLGWMSNWRYANQLPTESFRSAMTLPRELTLRTTQSGIRLFQSPVKELGTLEETISEKVDVSVAGNYRLADDLKTGTLKVELTVDPTDSRHFQLVLPTTNGEKTVIGYESDTSRVYIDRSLSGEDRFHEDFSGCHAAYVPPTGRPMTWQVYVDHSSVELFVNDGEVVLTDLIFSEGVVQGVELTAEEGHAAVSKLKVARIRSAM